MPSESLGKKINKQTNRKTNQKNKPPNQMQFRYPEITGKA